jgi:hypothetical protein
LALAHHPCGDAAFLFARTVHLRTAPRRPARRGQQQGGKQGSLSESVGENGGGDRIADR